METEENDWTGVSVSGATPVEERYKRGVAVVTSGSCSIGSGDDDDSGMSMAHAMWSETSRTTTAVMKRVKVMAASVR